MITLWDDQLNVRSIVFHQLRRLLLLICKSKFMYTLLDNVKN